MSGRAKGALCLLLAATAVGLFFLLFERGPAEVDKPLSGEAAIDPYFALRELFATLGVEARSSVSLEELPSRAESATLILALGSGPLPETDLRRLFDWVESGGHVLLEAESGFAAPFQESSFIYPFYSDSDDGDDEESRSSFNTARPLWPKLYYDLEDEEPLRVDGEIDSAWALTSVFGQGAITLVQGLGPFTNLELGKKDHAELAWWLAAWNGPPRSVWIVSRRPQPSVWSLLASRARPVSLALAVLCLAALARFARPFGPKLPPAPRDRRHLKEHLDASGRFLWQREVEHVLLEAAQAAAAQRLARGRRLDLEQLVAHAARSASERGLQLDSGEIRECLTLPSTRDRQQFTRTISVLETLRRAT